MTANRRIFLNIVAPVRRSLGVGGTYGRSLCAVAVGALLTCNSAMAKEDSKVNVVVESLSKSTVRIVAFKNGTNVTSVGTAFLVSLNVNTEASTHVPVLVTNKHVIDGCEFVRFVFSEIAERGKSPSLVPVVMPTALFKNHPDGDVDLCAIPLAPILREVKKKHRKLNIAPLPVSIISKSDGMKDLRQLDEVVMVGYPDGLIDEVNNQPIFRRGVIATDPFIDYRGKKEFLLDIAAYPGSSGSPVFILREGVFFDRNKGSAMLCNGGYCMLIGILYAGHMHDVTGRPVSTPIPTSTDVKNPWVPNNLGIVIKADRLLDFEKIFK